MVEIAAIKKCEPFHLCSSGEIENILLPSITEYCFDEKGSILRKGEKAEGVHLIIEGRVKLLSKTSDNKALITEINGKGEMLGYDAVITQTPYPIDAIAIERTRTYLVSPKDFLFILQHNDRFLKKVLGMVCAKFETTRKQMLNLCYMPVRQRVAGALLYLSKANYSKKIKSFTAYRTDIAKLAGMRRETASRLLREFVSEGLLTIEGEEIAIDNFDKLEKIKNLYN